MSHLRYAIRLDAVRHLAEIELRFPVDTDTAQLALPAWSPGSYLIRDYARFVRDLAVTGDDGAPRRAAKRDKSSWTIDASGARELHVRYAVYGHDLSVRTNHIDADHAFLHGPATFLCPSHLRAAPVEVELALPDDWVLTTAMAWDPSPPYRLTAADIDELYDHPIHAGPTRTLEVRAAVPVKLAIWGARAPGGTFDERRLAADLGAIVDDHIARFGTAPFAHYTFLVMLARRRASTTRGCSSCCRTSYSMYGTESGSRRPRCSSPTTRARPTRRACG
jgi:predicted metalloprotease with PDZ domain